MSDTILEVRNIKRYYPVKKGLIIPKQVGQVKAVDDVSFRLKRGKTIGIVGESGCGKTTLSRVLLGLDRPTEGTISFYPNEGGVVENYGVNEKIQMVFQDPYASLDPRMDVERIIGEPLRVAGGLTKEERRKRVIDILDQVGLPRISLSKYPHEFSGGQRQRIGIARALVTNPEILICDEPVSALDVSVQAQILNLLKDIQKDRNVTYIFISHDISVIRYVSDEVMVMYLGQVMELSPKSDFFKGCYHPYSKALLSAVPDPNPSNNTKKFRLSGNVPSPLDMPKGCPFCTRCPLAVDKCCECRPGLNQVGLEDGHYSSCLFNEGDHL
jgi:oligopeptide/dipeptide ABC transporter ATP-binding protein